MDIKVLKATKQALESKILQFSKIMRIRAAKWKPNYRTSSEEELQGTVIIMFE